MKKIKLLMLALFFIATTFTFAKSNSSNCKGLSKSSCNSGCTWVNSYTRKYRAKTVSVKGYCRKSTRAKTSNRSSHIKKKKTRKKNKLNKRSNKSTGCRSLKRKGCIGATDCKWKPGNRKLKTKGKCIVKRGKRSKKEKIYKRRKKDKKIRSKRKSSKSTSCSSKRRRACITASNCKWKPGNRKTHTRGKCLTK